MLNFTTQKKIAAVPEEENGLFSGQPQEPAAPHPQPPPHRRELPEDAVRAAGRGLALARERKGMTLEQVGGETRIKMDHLRALEAGELGELPQMIYVLAYVNKLGRLYGLPDEERNALCAPLRDITYEIPDNLSKTLEVEPSEENRKLLRQMGIVLGVAAVLFIIVLVVVGSVLFLKLRGGSGAPAVPVDEARILQLQKAPALAIPPPVKAGGR